MRPQPRCWPPRPGWNTRSLPSRSRISSRKVGSLLTENDHKRRLDRLLLNDSRWAGERNERAAVIRRVIALLSEPEQKKAQARLAVFLRAKNSEQLMAKLPPLALKTEWGLAIQRAQALRRQKKHEAAWEILLTEPDATLHVKPDGWWEERRAGAYAALKAGKAKTAYELVRDPGNLSVNAQNGASFMAGWVALRHLNDAKKALAHFQAFTKSADGPLSQARAYYWLGRTYETLGDQAKARESYRTAAAHIDTFHGQLARLKLDPQASGLQITPPATPTAEEIARFNGLDAVQAIVLADKAGLDRSAPVRVPQSPALSFQDRGRSRHAGAPGRGAGRHADGRPHRQDGHRAWPEPHVLRLSGTPAARLHAVAPSGRDRLHSGHCAAGERVQHLDILGSRVRAASCRSCRSPRATSAATTSSSATSPA